MATDDAYSVDEDTTLIVDVATTAPTANLVGSWDMDGMSPSQTVTDSSGSGADGTLGSTGGVDGQDPVWTTSSRVGTGALSFDGVDDYVQTTSNTLQTANSFTISVWFQTDTTTGQHHMVWQGVSTANGWGYPDDPSNSEMHLSVGSWNQDNVIAFFWGYDSDNPESIDITSSSFTDTSGWHHAAVVVTDLGGGTVSAELFVDGVSEGSDTGTQIDRSAWDTDLRLGRPGEATRYFDGKMDEVRLYDRALSTAEVGNLYHGGVLVNDSDADGDLLVVLDHSQPSNGAVTVNSDGSFSYTPDPDFNGTDSFTYLAAEAASGTTHYWNLDGTATDSVGGSDGTLNGATTVAGEYGNALSFDEVDDYVEIPDIAYSNEFTISFKFKIDGNAGNDFQYIYSHGTVATPNSVSIYASESGFVVPDVLRTRVLDSNDSDTGDRWIDIDIGASGLNYIGDGQWHDYTLTVASGAGSQVFLDGVLRGSNTKGGDAIDPVGSLVIGGRNDLDPSRFFGGELQHVQILNRALDASEIVDHHNDVSRATVVLTVNPINDAPVVGLPGGPLNFSEGDGPSVIDAAATLSDVDSPDFDGGTLTVEFTANATANDRLAIDSNGGPGNISVNGSNVRYNFGSGPVTIGTFSGGTDGFTPLSVTLNANADEVAVRGAASEHHVRERLGDSVHGQPDGSIRSDRRRWGHQQRRDRDDQRLAHEHGAGPHGRESESLLHRERPAAGHRCGPDADGSRRHGPRRGDREHHGGLRRRRRRASVHRSAGDHRQLRSRQRRVDPHRNVGRGELRDGPAERDLSKYERRPGHDAADGHDRRR